MKRNTYIQLVFHIVFPYILMDKYLCCVDVAALFYCAADIFQFNRHTYTIYTISLWWLLLAFIVVVVVVLFLFFFGSFSHCCLLFSFIKFIVLDISFSVKIGFQFSFFLRLISSCLFVCLIPLVSLIEMEFKICVSEWEQKVIHSNHLFCRSKMHIYFI